MLTSLNDRFWMTWRIRMLIRRKRFSMYFRAQDMSRSYSKRVFITVSFNRKTMGYARERKANYEIVIYIIIRCDFLWTWLLFIFFLLCSPCRDFKCIQDKPWIPEKTWELFQSRERETSIYFPFVKYRWWHMGNSVSKTNWFGCCVNNFSLSRA